MELSDEKKAEIASHLEGTSGSYDGAVMNEHGIDVSELEEIMSEHGIERCETCGWWCETSEFDENQNCADCQ